jgi:hypothetical protein
MFTMPVYKKKPYEDGECRHDSTFDRKGELTCLKCGMVYNEVTLTWEYKEGGD